MLLLDKESLLIGVLFACYQGKALKRSVQCPDSR